jgi:integrase
MAKLTFFTKTITTDKNALVPIYVKLQWGKPICIVCKSDLVIKPDYWNNENQKAISGKKKDYNPKPINVKIFGLRDTIEKEIETTHQSDLIAMLGERNPEKGKSRDRNKKLSEWLLTIIDKHWHPDKYKVTLFSYIQEFIDKSESKPTHKTGRPAGVIMRYSYEKVFKTLKEFAEEKKRVIDFQNVDLQFFDDFIQYLQSQNLAMNTIKQKITVLKVFLNSAKEEGKNPYDMFKSGKFSVKGEESESVYLNETELAAIYKLNLKKDEILDQTRDLFIVASWTGCRFTDIGQITPESISNGFIHITQYKTGAKVVIPLKPVVSAILNKYNGILPKVVNNMDFNNNLRIIAEKAKINEKTHKAITKGGIKTSKAYKKHELVTAHSARRSFATNLFLSGFPSLSIMAITGHTTEESFMRYIKVTPDEHAQKLQDHWGLSNLKVV